MKTPAQLHDSLVKAGAERFVETYLALMKHESQGGRLPGIVIPPKEELLDIYHRTNEEYWRNLTLADPEEAQAQADQYASLGPANQSSEGA